MKTANTELPKIEPTPAKLIGHWDFLGPCVIGHWAFAPRASVNPFAFALYSAKWRYMKAVLLAAGKGTRMGELTRELPKPMLNAFGKPILEHIVTGIATAGI